MNQLFQMEKLKHQPGSPAIREFFDFLQSSAFGIGAENGQSSENPELINKADAVGFGQPAINEFVKNLQLITNGMGAENDNSSENPELINAPGRHDAIRHCSGRRHCQQRNNQNYN
jgi:hypothetical protein